MSDEINIGAITEALNDKADIDLNNTDFENLENSSGKLLWKGENVVTHTGMIAVFGGTYAPAGWLKCDGSTLSRTTYAKLFAVIGGNYGAGDGSTTFNLPTQSVLPLGLYATVSVYGNGKSLGLTTGSNNGTMRYWDTKLIADTRLGYTLPYVSGASNWKPTTDSLIGIIADASLSGITGSVNIANATGAKAIVCIKY